MNLIDECVAKMDSMPINRDKELSIVYKVVSNYDKKTAASLIIDMVIGGIVTVRLFTD